MNISKIINKALDYRRNILGLSDFEPIENSYQLAEEAGFFIIALPLSQKFAKKEERGFYLKIGTSNFIFINTSCYLSTQNFTIWHEIYHSLYPIDVSNSTEDEIDQDETNAELFASVILLPPEVIKEHLNNSIKNNWLFNNQILDLAIRNKIHYKAVLTLINKLYPQFRDKGYLYSKEKEAVKELDIDKKEEYDKLIQIKQKHITRAIFEAIENNYRSEKIDNDELIKINKLIEEVVSIDE
ncbi:ImmA/IrrE family metallo-endopeptidase [Staphylococcus hominis]|uniref:ImmA/IrrE family metallo-endopeptidase n=1 Tax=Staphylococcus hominis TaxID=1290 RepID=UPI002879F549|nr:ImmA/IrrE family metallo-endopeptidase [Staphylococcus hominis]MDS3850781.1 ImmA/IrrE family metallo-endopeptidase [Staphylococcus hominis]